MSNTPFSDMETHLLPPPLSMLIDNLLSEQELHGINTTADETALLIEVWFKFLGGLMLSEYLNYGAPSKDLNRWLFSLLADKRPILSGTWIALARECKRSLEQTTDVEWQPKMNGLKAFDFGENVNSKNTIATLMYYRNHFSHGSFSQVEEEILEHGRLLEGEIRFLYQNLVDNPIYTLLINGNTVKLQGTKPFQYATTEINPIFSENIPPGTTFQKLANNKINYLSPAIKISNLSDDIWTLEKWQISAKKELLPESLMEKFLENLETYRKEQYGFVKFDTTHIPNQASSLPLNVPRFDETFSSEGNFTRINYHSGTDQYLLAAKLLNEVNKSSNSSYIWRVIINEHSAHPSQNGNVFARSLLRHTEMLLGYDSGSLETYNKDVLFNLKATGELLLKENKSLTCIMMDAENALVPIDNGLSIAEVFNSIEGGIKLILLSANTFYSNLPFDNEILYASLPPESEFNQQEFSQAISSWLKTDNKIRAELLHQLSVDLPLDITTSPFHFWVNTLREKVHLNICAPAVEHALGSAGNFLIQFTDENQQQRWKFIPSHNNYYQQQVSKTLEQLRND